VILQAISAVFTVFWNVMTCRLLYLYRCFRRSSEHITSQTRSP